MGKENAGILRVAVIGVGSFGRNHARVYRELANACTAGKLALAAVVDLDRARAEAVAAEFGTRAYSDINNLLANEKIDAASVTVPTKAHLAMARGLIEAGVDVLVEKPLAVNLGEADALIELARKHRRITQVGHLERFNPAVRAVRPHITRPMFFEVHRLSVFSPRSLDVDVVMDLMIHDLDIVLSLVNSPIRDIRAVGLPVLTPEVDIANVRVEFNSGCVANFTASRVSTERVRKLRFFQPRQYVSLDYSRRDVFVLTVKPTDQNPAAPEIVPSKPAVVNEEPLRAELNSFLEAVIGRTPPAVSLEDGRRALELALRIRAQMEEHSRRVGLPALMSTS